MSSNRTSKYLILRNIKDVDAKILQIEGDYQGVKKMNDDKSKSEQKDVSFELEALKKTNHIP